MDGTRVERKGDLKAVRRRRVLRGWKDMFMEGSFFGFFEEANRYDRKSIGVIASLWDQQA